MAPQSKITRGDCANPWGLVPNGQGVEGYRPRYPRYHGSPLVEGGRRRPSECRWGDNQCRRKIGRRGGGRAGGGERERGRGREGAGSGRGEGDGGGRQSQRDPPLIIFYNISNKCLVFLSIE